MAAPMSVPRPADSHPDHHLDGIGRREFPRIDDSDLRHIKRAGHSCQTGREREHEELVALDPVAQKSGPAFRVPDGDEHLSEPRRDNESGRSRNPKASAIAEAARSPERIPSDWSEKPRKSLKSVSPLLPPNPMLLRKKASISANVRACVMMEK